MKSVQRSMMCISCIVLLSSCGSAAESTAQKAMALLQERCMSCHNDETADAGLSLATRESLLKGGSRGAAIELDEPSQSVLLKMIQVDAYPRMPFESEHLSGGEIQLLEDWVEEGAKYVAPTASAVTSGRLKKLFESIAARLSELAFAPIVVPHKSFRGIPFWPVTIGFPLMLLLGRIVQTQTETRTRWSKTQTLLISILIPSVLNLALLVKSYRAELNPNSSQGMQHQVHMLYGEPPIPVNLHSNNALSRRYYRGNDERSELMFNNGNYLTCTFDLCVESDDGIKISHGEKLHDGQQLYASITIDRAPYTADVLFDSKMMGGIFLTDDSNLETCLESTSRVFVSETVKSQTWQGRVSLGTITDGKIESLIYMWQRHRKGNTEFLPKLHYALKVFIQVDAGVVTDQSTLWFNSMRVTKPIMNGTIPISQWLSASPIPALPAQNIDDHELLGAGEHVGTAGEK